MISFSTLRSKLRAIPIHGLSNLSSLLAHPKPYNTEATGTIPKPLSSLFLKPASSSRVRDGAVQRGRRRIRSSDSARYRAMEEKEFPKELSPEAASLVRRLREEGYLKEANFEPNFAGEAPMDPSEIPPNLYSRHFLKSAAERFGQDHQEIAKWLSGSDLKKVALFGCPSVERKTVFAAKRLRSFFSIQEDTTCHACKLKKSCKFVHQKVARQEKLILPDVMRVLTLFALDAIPRQLFVPLELKLSADKLLKEVINLSS
ncbi:uncharacterized protein LOC109716025 [Ananas comosus]|uniref:Uncharacterized protein LOC109716025 n=1 Tax=Ananas comosus TaxID=4615 RepID=A0A6P5FML3_ANACO|nr:uncharacterized protein LOC109716025 [Ananas comosus]